MKKLFKIAVLVFVVLPVLSFSQDRKKEIVFLADTIHVRRDNQILEIESEGAYKYYSFFCKCIPGYDRNVTFNYHLGNENKILDKKPAMAFTSWKLLADIIYKAGSKFDLQYHLIIVEALPDNRYTVNPVKLYVRAPVVDYIKLKQ